MIGIQEHEHGAKASKLREQVIVDKPLGLDTAEKHRLLDQR